MYTKKIFFNFSLLLCFSFAIPPGLKAQSLPDGLEGKDLQRVLQLDSLFWNAYNNCDTDSYRPFFTEDLEFYHDKGGVTETFEKILESTKNGMCGNPDWRLRREVVEGSVVLYPMLDKGKLYGAVLSGEHLFFVSEKDKAEYLDGIARFTHLWLLQDEEWRMSRILSYDHRPAGHNPNKKEIVLSQKALQQFTGSYEAKPDRTITISEEPNGLRLRDGDFQAMLFPEGENAFYMKERNVHFEFVKDEKNQVLKMLVKENGEMVDQADKVRNAKE